MARRRSEGGLSVVAGTGNVLGFSNGRLFGQYTGYS
jgi:hypothetical protein